MQPFRSFSISAEDSAVCQSNRITVEIDCAVICEAGDGAVAGKCPDAVTANGDHSIVCNSSAAFFIINNINGAGERAVSG